MNDVSGDAMLLSGLPIDPYVIESRLTLFMLVGIIVNQ